MGDQIQVTKLTVSDIEIDLLFITSNSFKTQQKVKDFVCNMFEFIIILWSLIFIKSIRCILEVQQDRLSGTIRREIGKSSTREYNLWVNYSHFAAGINFFLPLDYS